MTLILGKCRYCDRPLEQSERGRNKVYCDDECRKKYEPYRRAEEKAHGSMG